MWKCISHSQLSLTQDIPVNSDTVWGLPGGHRGYSTACFRPDPTHPETFLPGRLQQLDHLQRTAQLRDGGHRVTDVVAVLIAVAEELRVRRGQLVKKQAVKFVRLLNSSERSRVTVGSDRRVNPFFFWQRKVAANRLWNSAERVRSDYPLWNYFFSRIVWSCLWWQLYKEAFFPVCHLSTPNFMPSLALCLQ